jgi:hypothetical protein
LLCFVQVYRDKKVVGAVRFLNLRFIGVKQAHYSTHSTVNPLDATIAPALA